MSGNTFWQDRRNLIPNYIPADTLTIIERRDLIRAFLTDYLVRIHPELDAAARLVRVNYWMSLDFQTSPFARFPYKPEGEPLPTDAVMDRWYTDGTAVSFVASSKTARHWGTRQIRHYDLREDDSRSAENPRRSED